VRTAFREVFPDVQEVSIERFIEPEETILRVVLTGISLGAGLVAAELLKECAKDLWRVVRRLILPKDKRAAAKSGASGDRIEVELKIGAFSMTEVLSDLSLRSEEQEVRVFLERELAKMFFLYSGISIEIKVDTQEKDTLDSKP